MACNVIIVEDQNLPRQYFCDIVAQAPGYHLAESFSSAEGVIAYCRRNAVDLVLLDVLLGEGNDGLSLANQIKRDNPRIKILVVTQMPEASYLKRARAIGVDSFWYKDVVGMSLLKIMDKTMAGECIYPDAPPLVKIGAADNTCFTPRELEVLRLLTTGANDNEIAEKLNLSYETVRTHVKHMTEKTGLSRVRLAIEARTTGIAIG